MKTIILIISILWMQSAVAFGYQNNFLVDEVRRHVRWQQRENMIEAQRRQNQLLQQRNHLIWQQNYDNCQARNGFAFCNHLIPGMNNYAPPGMNNFTY